MTKAKQGRRWCATIFPPQDILIESKELIVDLIESMYRDAKITYFLSGLETCPQTGRLHLQCYLEVPKRKTLAGMKALMKDLWSPHLELALGTLDQNRTYCLKENNLFLEIGTPMSQGQRSDLLEVKKKIDNKTPMHELWQSDFNTILIWGKRLQEYAQSLQKPRSDFSEIWILWGETGTGKTRQAHEMAKELGVTPYVWMPSNGFMQGYIGQEVAIFDEFDGSQLTFSFWKQLCDRYPMTVNVKGGQMNWNPKKIIFTSNMPPHAWWKDDRNVPVDWLDQFKRRIKESKGKVIHFTKLKVFDDEIYV